MGKKATLFLFLFQHLSFLFLFFWHFCKREVIRLRCDQSAVPISPVWWDHREKLSVVVQPPAISGARAASGLCAYQRIWLSMFETGQLLFCPGPGSRPAGGHVLILRLKEVFVR